VKNLLSPAVNRGDLYGDYSKTVFGRGSTPDPIGRAYDALPDPKSNEEGILPPHSPQLLPQDPRARRSPSELIGTPCFRPNLRPWVHVYLLITI